MLVQGAPVGLSVPEGKLEPLCVRFEDAGGVVEPVGRTVIGNMLGELVTESFNDAVADSEDRPDSVWNSEVDVALLAEDVGNAVVVLSARVVDMVLSKGGDDVDEEEVSSVTEAPVELGSD